MCLVTDSTVLLALWLLSLSIRGSAVDGIIISGYISLTSHPKRKMTVHVSVPLAIVLEHIIIVWIHGQRSNILEKAGLWIDINTLKLLESIIRFLSLLFLWILVKLEPFSSHAFDFFI